MKRDLRLTKNEVEVVDGKVIITSDEIAEAFAEELSLLEEEGANAAVVGFFCNAGGTK